MMKPIKITMLADRGVGKTCYMLGMYGGMLQDNHGFSLTAKNQDQGMFLMSQWNNIIESKQWPPKTDENDAVQYDFCLNYAGETLTEFQWFDYRGGAISDVSDREDVKELRKNLAESSCLFLSISGEYLINPISDNLGLAMVQTKANIMNNHLVYIREQINKNNQKYFPVVIAISKHDYCYDRPKAEIIADVKRLFSILFQPESKWLVMICPITLGKELAKNPNGKIDPLNVHLPVIFALWCSLRQNILFAQRNIEQIEEKLENFENMNWLLRFFNRNQINLLEKQKENYETLQQKNLEIMETLKQELQDAYIYLGGEELQINDD